MDSCGRLLVFGILVLAVCSNDGLESEQPEDRQQGRGRLHQHCKRILNEEDLASRKGLPKHDRIRHHRQKSKCKHHMKAEEDCRTKYKPANGTVRSFHDNFYGWVVSVRCHRGYSLQGQSSVICYEDLKENERPFCEIKDCGEPTSRKNTTYTYTTTTYESKLLVECDPGFNITGSRRSKCLASGKWSNVARCVLKECPPIKNPAFGIYHETQNVNGDQTIFFECAPGYRLVGANQTSCHYGMWTSPEPKCMQKPDESTVVNTGLTTGLVVFNTLLVILGVIMAVSYKYYSFYRKHQQLSNAKIPDEPYITPADDESQSLAVDQTQPQYEELITEGVSINIKPTESRSCYNLFSPSHTRKDLIPQSFDSGCSDIYLSSIDTLEQSGSSFAQHSVRDVEGIPNTTYGIFEQRGSQVVNPTDEEPSTADVTSSLSAPVHAVCRELEIPVLNNRTQLPTCLVTPLKAGDEQTNGPVLSHQHNGTGQEIAIKEKDSPADFLGLNWNKLFSYLVPKVCTDNWKLFAINLLGERLPHGQSACSTISQIENRSKTQQGGEKIEIILLNILWYWKNLQKSANLHDIETALRWSHHDDVIHSMNDAVRTFYEPIDEADGNSSLNQIVLAGIPELQYRIEPKESEIALLPCYEERVNTHEMVPVTPFTEERMTCDYQIAASTGLHYHKDKRFYKAKRRYSYYTKYQKLCNRYKFPARNGIPLRRQKLKAKPKVEVNTNEMTLPHSGEVLRFTEMDTMFVNLLIRILDLDPSKKLNPTEFRLLTKYVLYKIHTTTFANTELDDILGITFEDFSLCDHVPTPRNGTLHIINSDTVRVILMDEEWSLVEKYVCRARNVVVKREPEMDQPLLFLTHEGNQVTNEYLQVNMNSSTIPERTNDTDCKDNKAALDTSAERTNDTESKNNKAALNNSAERNIDTESKDNKASLDTSAERANDTESKDSKAALDTSAERTNDTESKDSKAALNNCAERNIDTESKDNKASLDTSAERTNDTESKDSKAALDTSAERTNDTESKDSKAALDTSAERTNDTDSKNNKAVLNNRAERNIDTECKDNKAALDTSDQTDAMDTTNTNEPSKVTLAQKKNQTFDVKRKLPVSRRSNYGRLANKVTTESDGQVRHGRRYFCEKQTVTIETVFKEEINQGSVKESTILSRFLNCNDLREAFGVESNNVNKMLVKKVADRVRCFIRRRNN